MASKLEFAQSAVYDLHNVAEHVDRMAQGAQSSLENGDVSGALSDLEIARRSVEQVESRFSWAIDACRKALEES